jgi:DNA primase
MPDNQVDEIKSRLDLAEIMRGYMKLEKSGINLRGLCPFHHEKTPSLFVSPSRQLWKCFGCSVGGDMFTFIQQIEGVDFKEALKTLADKAGVALRSYDPKVRSEKARLYEICEKASQFFEKQLHSSSLGQEALLYLSGRGINEESIKKFRLGLAPQTSASLCGFLREQGYSPAEIFKAGVSIQSAASYYDRFRGRIMFPIADLNGQIIGFGGRIFFPKNQLPDPKLAKYINTPQTLLYDKSRTLYGLDKAKLKIREQDNCILVEGYTDAIMAHQAGSENVLAVSGTALTEHQLDIVRRYSENLTTLFDMDIAGDTATKRGIDLAQKKGFNIKVITLPEGKDPAEIIQKDEHKWKKAIEHTLSIGDFYFETALLRFDKKTSEGMKNISRILLPMISQIPNRIEQSFWVQKLAYELACPEMVVWQDLEKVAVPNSASEPSAEVKTGAPVEQRGRTKSDILCERMILLAMKDRSCLDLLKKSDVTLFDKKLFQATVLLAVYNHRDENMPYDLSLGLNDAEKEYMNGLLFQEEIFPTFSQDSDFKLEFTACLDSLRRLALKEKLFALEREMKQGAHSDRAILEKFKKVSIELAKL